MSINQYRIFCITEMAFNTVWGAEPPTTCPVDTAHTVNPDSVTIEDTIHTNEVTIVVEENNKTNGHFGVRSWLIDIPAGTTGAITYEDVTFQYPISMMLVSFKSSDNSMGDTFSAEVAPDTIIGVCTTTANLGTTQIAVNNTVLSYLKPGFHMSIDTGVTRCDLGECINVDLNNFIVTSELPVSNINFSAGSYIRQTVRMTDDYILQNSQHRTLGTGKPGSSYIPAGRKLQVKYTNNNGLAKKFHIDLEYLY